MIAAALTPRAADRGHTPHDTDATLRPLPHVPSPMRLRPVSLTLSAAAAVLYLSSYSTGPASRGVDATSGGVGDRACGSCHNGGNYGASTTLSLFDAAGERVEAYVPGEAYTLRIDIATATAPGGYGFQVVALDADRATVGVYGEAPADTRVSELRGRTYFEHRRRLAAATHEIAWTAPPAGAGTVTVYGVGNAVNGNGGTSGDEVDEAVVRLPEAGASPVTEAAWPAGVTAAVPGGGVLEVRGGGLDGAGYTADLATADGRAVASRRVLAQAPLRYEALAPGVYVLRLTDGSGVAVARLVPVLY